MCHLDNTQLTIKHKSNKPIRDDECDFFLKYVIAVTPELPGNAVMKISHMVVIVPRNCAFNRYE